MPTGVIIQARMGSTRLPGKVLANLGGTSLLEFLIGRLKRSVTVSTLVVATSTNPENQPIVKFCNDRHIPVFQGPETDVLGRYLGCAKAFDIDPIIRVTGDCPLVDPALLDEMVAQFTADKLDYLANTVPPESSGWPDGSDIEIFSLAALQRAGNNTMDPLDREHVTYWFWKPRSGPTVHKAQYTNSHDWSDYRYTVDYPEDLTVVSGIIDALRKSGQKGTVEEIVNFLKENPTLRAINAEHYFNEGWTNR